MEPSELLTRAAVADLIARYTHAGDRGRSGELAALFTVDGVLDVGVHGGRWDGRAEIVRQLDAVADRVAQAGTSPGPVRHHVSSLLVETDGPTTATATAYFMVMTAIGVDHWGRYQDRVTVDTDGQWRFTHRKVRVDGSVPGSLMMPSTAS